MAESIEPLVRAWLAARSHVRGLPMPVADHGGYRIDTFSVAETARWVFPRMDAGLADLGRRITAPRHFLKLCGTDAALRAALPAYWRLHDHACFMIAGDAPPERPPPAGYRVESVRRDAVIAVRIVTADTGDLAASGYAADTGDAFVYDRIGTAPGHRRRGLGHALMAALRRGKTRGGAPELLVATADGRALYETLGWRVLSPYATASIPEAPPSRLSRAACQRR